jgi:hypothetical protein
VPGDAKTVGPTFWSKTRITSETLVTFRLAVGTLEVSWAETATGVLRRVARSVSAPAPAPVPVHTQSDRVDRMVPSRLTARKRLWKAEPSTTPRATSRQRN